MYLIDILSWDCNDENGFEMGRRSSGLGEYFCASRTKRLKT
jgi:hypothetical protein